MNAWIIGIAGYFGILAFALSLCRVSASTRASDARPERRGLNLVGDQPLPAADSLMNPNTAA